MAKVRIKCSSVSKLLEYLDPKESITVQYSNNPNSYLVSGCKIAIKVFKEQYPKSIIYDNKRTN